MEVIVFPDATNVPNRINPHFTAMATILSLTNWGGSVPSKEAVVDAYTGWPPVKLYPDGNFDLEYGPLLLADSIYMDEYAYQNLRNAKTPGLERVVVSLEKLRDTGFLVTKNYRSAIAGLEMTIKLEIEDRLGNPLPFLGGVRAAIDEWDLLSGDFSKRINRPDDCTATLPIGVLSALKSDGQKINFDDAERIRKIIFAKRKRYSHGETELLKEVVRPYLEHAYTTLALSKELTTPLIDWTDLQPVYEKVLSSRFERANETEKSVIKARELFSVALPIAEPSSVGEFLAVLKDKETKKFRGFVAQAAEGEISFTKATTENLLLSYAGNQNKLKGFSTVFNIFGALASFATLAAPPVIGGVTSLALPLAQRKAEEKLHETLHKDTGWVLAFARAKNSSNRR